MKDPVGHQSTLPAPEARRAEPGSLSPEPVYG